MPETINGGGDVIDSEGNLLNQTFDESIEPQEEALTQLKGRIGTTTTAGKCPEDTFDEDHGDPADALDDEDPDNDPKNDGCNPPTCPDPGPCDLEPQDLDCVYKVEVTPEKVTIFFLGIVFATDVISIDLYSFNTFDAATEFFDFILVKAADSFLNAELGSTILRFTNVTAFGKCAADLPGKGKGKDKGKAKNEDVDPELVGFSQTDENGDPVETCVNPDYL